MTATKRLSITRQPPITPELWRDAYARIAAQYAVFLERYDLAEDAQAEDIIRAIEREVRSDLARQVAADLSLPGHKCRMVARATPIMEGRDLWLGKLTEPYPGFEHETHCLHITTPHKAVVFGVIEADFDLLAVLGYIVSGRRGSHNERWLADRADAAILAGTDATPEPRHVADDDADPHCAFCGKPWPCPLVTLEPVSSIPQRTPFESDPESPR